MILPIFEPKGQKLSLDIILAALPEKQSAFIKFLDEMNAMQVFNLEEFSGGKTAAEIVRARQNPEGAEPWITSVSLFLGGNNIDLMRQYLGREVVNKFLEASIDRDRRLYKSSLIEVLEAVKAKIEEAGGKGIVDTEKCKCHLSFEGQAAVGLKEVVQAEYRYIS